MRRTICFALAVLFLAVSATSFASNVFPLKPTDTSSPRGVLESFLKYSELFDQAMRAPKKDKGDILEARERAERCFDLSEVAPSARSDVALESVLRLREVLDRIQLPDMADVPGSEEVKEQDIEFWRIPHTEIKISKATGARSGAFLFSPKTVARLDEFYDEVRDLPYKDGAVEGIYEDYIYSSGWLVPDGLIGHLPGWMRTGYLGQAVWQWLGLVIFLPLGAFLLVPVFLWHRKRKKAQETTPFIGGRVVFPLAAMGVCFGVRYILNTQINLTGTVQTVVSMGLEVAFYFFAAWAILAAGNIVTIAIISVRRIQEEALNADVIKLVCRLVSLGLVFVLFYRAGGHFGLPVAAVFASAGVAGVAVALAARETLANFFGGVSIFLDRPFRAGDYIVIESGERGEVRAVGMRSTRLLTRDDVLITIPNSVITNVKIVNQSAPRAPFRVRIKVGVAYGSDLDAVEEALLSSAAENSLVLESPSPRVRLRAFGDSSINYELLVWVGHPKYRGRSVHQISREIYRRFSEQDIVIPFPQRDVYLHKESE